MSYTVLTMALGPSVPPQSPANVQATDGTYFDQVTITWDTSAGATSYNVFRSDGISPYTQIAAGVAGLVYNDATVLSTTPYTYYVYKVIAVNSAGSSDIDSSATVPDQGYADPLKTHPNSPNNMTATDGTVVSTITVSWDAMSNTNFYRLYKSASSGGPYTLEQDNISGTTIDVNSAPSTTWWFRVSAVNGFGESSQSLPDVGHAMGLPNPPTTITASDTSYHYTDYINIQWLAATGEGTISGYNIYGCDTAVGTYTKLNTSVITNLSYDESVALEGQVRYYKISAVNEAGEGAQSGYVSGQTWGDQPAAPTGVMATQGTFTDKVEITWSSTADANGYRVYRANTINGTYTQIGSDLGLVVTFDDTSGTPGYHYFYKVTAFKTYGGESVQSNSAEGWILAAPDQVTGVSATDGTCYRYISVTWLAPTGTVSSYNVYKSTATTGTYTLLASGITLLNYTDNSPDVTGEGIHRFYKITAVNAAGEGPQSIYNEGSTMIVPSAPGSVSSSDGSFDDRVRTTWIAPSGPVNSYNVYRCDTSDCSGTVTTLATGVTALTYDDMIANHLTYYYMVSAVNDAGEGALSATDVGSTDDVTPPAVPASVAATQGDQAANVHITWNSASGAGWYNVYRSSTSDGTYTKINGANITSSFYDDPTVAGVHWFYKVTAENNAGESAQSSYAEGWAMNVAAQVTGVAASGGGSTTDIAVSWNAVSDALHYHVFKSSSLAGTYAMIADNVTATTYTDSSGLDATQHWYYKVSAVNPAGEGLESDADDGWVTVSAPTGISASQGTYDDLIRISWSASVGAAGYNVYSSTTQNGTYTKITPSPVADLSYDDLDMLLPGHLWYKVTAINGDGEGGYSSSVEGWPLDDGGIISTPANVVATQGSYTDRVTVTWNPASEAEYYNVYRSTSATGTYTIINGSNITSTTYTDSTVSCADHYFYKVTAVNDHGTESGQSAYSEGWAAPTWTNPPTNISATDGTLVGQITVTWTGTAGADYYNVYRSSTSGGTYTKVNTSNVAATTYTNTGITAGAHWFYKVTANNIACGGESVMSSYDEGYAMPIPDVPAGVSATDKANAGLEGTYPYCNTTAIHTANAANGIDGVTITWNPSSNATSYNVYRSDPAYDGSGTYGSYTKINSSPVTGTSFLDDYGIWDGNPATFRRLINAYRYTVSAVNAAGESAQSDYDEGSAQITTSEFFYYMYDTPLRYSGERLVDPYRNASGLITYNVSTTMYDDGGSGYISWVYNITFIPAGSTSRMTYFNMDDYSYSDDFSSASIYTNSIHNYHVTLNGRLYATYDIYGSGWNNSVNSSNNAYCSGTCSEPPEASSGGWNVSDLTYSAYLHTVTVDSDCYGWAMLHAYTPNGGTLASSAYTWVSYRGQRPVRMDKTSLGSYYNVNGCP